MVGGFWNATGHDDGCRTCALVSVNVNGVLQLAFKIVLLKIVHFCSQRGSFENNHFEMAKKNHLRLSRAFESSLSVQKLFKKKSPIDPFFD